MLEEIMRACEEYRNDAFKPFRFHVRLPLEHEIFNHELGIDLMWHEVQPILRHIVDTHALFRTAVVLESKSTRGI